MKLAYLSESWVPSRNANAVHVMKMSQAFAALGHDLTLVAQGPTWSQSDGPDAFEFYGVERSFGLVRVPRPDIKGGTWLYGLLAGRLARRLRVDAVFGRSLHACAIAATMGLPTIWDAHMLTFLHASQERWLFRRMITARAFRGMTTNCDSLRRAVLAEVPQIEGRIVAAHNGADPIAKDVQPTDIGNTRGRLQAGYVGQLYPGKGLELIRELAARAPWADFHVVGGVESAVESLKHEATLPANIRVHGFVPPAETRRYCLAFDVLLAPYQRRVEVVGGAETSAWMSPLKLFEYMAAGKPILCSDLPVLREIIDDGRNGLLLPPDDVGAWVAALHHLAGCATERERLGAAARAELLLHHTWRERARRVLAGLEQGVLAHTK